MSGEIRETNVTVLCPRCFKPMVWKAGGYIYDYQKCGNCQSHIKKHQLSNGDQRTIIETIAGELPSSYIYPAWYVKFKAEKATKRL